MFNINSVIKRELIDIKTGKIHMDIEIVDPCFIDTNISLLYKDIGECKVYDKNKTKSVLICEVDRINHTIKSAIINVYDKRRYSQSLTVFLNKRKKIVNGINIELTGHAFNDAVKIISLVCDFSEKHNDRILKDVFEDIVEQAYTKLTTIEPVSSTSALYEEVSNILSYKLQEMFPFNKVFVSKGYSKSSESFLRKHRNVKINISLNGVLYGSVSIPIEINVFKVGNALYRLKCINYSVPIYSSLSINQLVICVLNNSLKIA